MSNYLYGVDLLVKLDNVCKLPFLYLYCYHTATANRHYDIGLIEKVVLQATWPILQTFSNPVDFTFRRLDPLCRLMGWDFGTGNNMVSSTHLDVLGHEF